MLEEQNSNNDNRPETETQTGAPEVSNAEIVQELKKDKKVSEFVEEAKKLLDDVNFLTDAPWIEHAIKGLKKPDIDVRLEKQFEKTVLKRLMSEAAAKVKPGEPINTPTSETVRADVKKMMDKRRKELQDAKDRKLHKAISAVKNKVD